MNPKVRSAILFASFFVVTLILDQVVKAWIRGAIPEHGSLSGRPWPAVFELTLTYNKGIAFGMMTGLGRLLSPIAIIIGGSAIVYSFRHPEESWPSHVCMGLIASGALGNLIDRIWHGQVTDMFWFKAINFPVFNVADACITVAVIMLMIIWIRESLVERAELKANQGAEVETEPL